MPEIEPKLQLKSIACPSDLLLNLIRVVEPGKRQVGGKPDRCPRGRAGKSGQPQFRNLDRRDGLRTWVRRGRYGRQALPRDAKLIQHTRSEAAGQKYRHRLCASYVLGC